MKRLAVASLCIATLSGVGVVIQNRDRAPFQQETEDNIWRADGVLERGLSIKNRISVAESHAQRLLADDRMVELNPEGASMAIAFLGQIRSVESLPVLCRRLLHEVSSARKNALIDPKRDYAAYEALVRIGIPSVVGIFDHISKNDTSEQYRRVATDLIIEICGRDSFDLEFESYKRPRLASLEEAHNRRLGQLHGEFKRRYRK